MRNLKTGPFPDVCTRACRNTSEIPVILESGGTIGGDADRLLDSSLCQSCGKGSFDEAVLSGRDGRLRSLRVMPRDDVHGTAKGVRAVDRGSGAKKHFDPFDILQWHGDVGIMMPRLRVVDPHPVHQDQNLREGGSAHGEIGSACQTERANEYRRTRPAQGCPRWSVPADCLYLRE